MMEEKQIQRAHKVTIDGRKTGTISGVSDVLSFDENEVLLETGLGTLQIKGKELHVNRLTLEKGEIDISGRIDSMVYSENGHTKKQGESLLGRLFK